MAIANNTNMNMQVYDSSDGPVAIFWDIENCDLPSAVLPEDVGGNIITALQAHPQLNLGVVIEFSAYGDFSALSRALREGCQRTGVKLIDVPNGRKDAADKAILVDMLFFAFDHPPPLTIVLISGDVDFARALHGLGQRGYTVIPVIPSGVVVSLALCNAGKFVFDWPSLARGECSTQLSMTQKKTKNSRGFSMYTPPSPFVFDCPSVARGEGSNQSSRPQKKTKNSIGSFMDTPPSPFVFDCPSVARGEGSNQSSRTQKKSNQSSRTQKKSNQLSRTQKKSMAPPPRSCRNCGLPHWLRSCPQERAARQRLALEQRLAREPYTAP